MRHSLTADVVFLFIAGQKLLCKMPREAGETRKSIGFKDVVVSASSTRRRYQTRS